MRFPGTGAPVTQGRGGRGTRPRFPGTGPRVTQGGRGPRMRIPSIPRVPFGGVVRSVAGPFINTLLAIWDFSDRKASGQTNTQAAAGTAGGILGGIAAAALAATLFPEPAFHRCRITYSGYFKCYRLQYWICNSRYSNRCKCSPAFLQVVV